MEIVKLKIKITKNFFKKSVDKFNSRREVTEERISDVEDDKRK